MKINIIDSPRPEAKDEDRVTMEEMRGALERIATALELPGSPGLVSGVPAAVERLAECLARLWPLIDESIEIAGRITVSAVTARSTLDQEAPP